MEIWKDIPGYEGLYQVSNIGRVKSLGNNKSRKNKILKYLKSSTYLQVTLYNRCKEKRYYIHQLVAIVFLNHTPKGHKIVVDHKDNNPLNNRIDNLQIICQRKNTSKDRKNGKSKYVGVFFEESSKRWLSSIYYNGNRIHLGYFDTELESSEYYQNALKAIENGTEIITKTRKTLTSEYKGVCWNKNAKKWVASFKLGKLRKHLGYFKSEEEAHLAYQNHIKNNN